MTEGREGKGGSGRRWRSLRPPPRAGSCCRLLGAPAPASLASHRAAGGQGSSLTGRCGSELRLALGAAPPAGGEALERVAAGRCGGSRSAGWGLQQPGLGGVPAHSKAVGTRWPLSSSPASAPPWLRWHSPCPAALQAGSEQEQRRTGHLPLPPGTCRCHPALTHLAAANARAGCRRPAAAARQLFGFQLCAQGTAQALLCSSGRVGPR